MDEDQSEIQATIADQAVADQAIAEILNEIVPQTAETPAPAAQAAESVAPEPTADASAPVPSGPENDRGILRILEREAAVSTRERDVERLHRELEGRLKAAEERTRGLIDPKDLVSRLLAAPGQTLESLGVAPEDFTALVVADRLGDKAPPEMREKAREFAVRREIEALKQQIRERDFREEVSRVRNGARDYLGGTQKAGESKHPELVAVAAVNPDLVVDEIFAEIARDAQARKLTEPGSQYLTYDEAAAKVNARWEIFRKAFTPAQAPKESTPTPAPESAPKAAITSPAAPPRIPATPAPQAKPKVPYWEDPDYEVARREALDAALKDAGIRR